MFFTNAPLIRTITHVWRARLFAYVLPSVMDSHHTPARTRARGLVGKRRITAGVDFHHPRSKLIVAHALRLCNGCGPCRRYLSACSSLSNSGVLKNAPSVMPSPSHSILIVMSLGFLLFPYKIFLMDEGGSAQRVASLLIVIFRSPQSCNILCLSAKRRSPLCRYCQKSGCATFFETYAPHLRLWRGQRDAQGKPCYARALTDLTHMSSNPN